jgi:ribosomal protein L11 methyltransferase
MLYHQLTIAAPARLQARIINLVMQRGSLGVIEQTGRIVAYFPSSTDIASVMNELIIIGALFERSSSRHHVAVEQAQVPELDWNETWKKSFQPLSVGSRMTVLPPWEKTPRGRIALVIDPGMAFGTGHHETTRSCLLLMEKHARNVPRGAFLDLGTGTGLLAIAARKLGFPSAVGLDTDPLAIRAARRNRTLNKVTGIVLREGGIDAVRGKFSMIAANLIAGTLIDLAQAIADRTSPAGIVIMSGILKGQDRDVLAAARKAGLTSLERLRDGKWVSLVLER